MQEVELIELIDSPEKMMNRIGRGDLGLIPDEEFTLNDGEKDTIEEDVVATMEEAIEEVAESTSDSIQPQPVQDTQFIETVENISEQGQRIVQAMEMVGWKKYQTMNLWYRMAKMNSKKLMKTLWKCLKMVIWKIYLMKILTLDKLLKQQRHLDFWKMIWKIFNRQ